MYVSGDRDSGDFQGIADTREAAVNCEKAVEIFKFHVVPGQEVKAGDLLAELDRPELNIRINEISHELEEFRNRRVSNVEQIRARMRQREAPESPETIRAQGLEKELALLHMKKENLRIYSKLDGVIGSVCFKPGEMVFAFWLMPFFFLPPLAFADSAPVSMEEFLAGAFGDERLAG